MHGEGVMTWQNPQVRYVGSWWNGKRYGQGRITFAEDDEAERVHYEGTMFAPGCYLFRVVLTLIGCTLSGWWQNDRKEGWGEMVWKSGSHYQGEWKSGLRDGFGVHTFHNADKYPIPFLSAQRSSSNF